MNVDCHFVMSPFNAILLFCPLFESKMETFVFFCLSFVTKLRSISSYKQPSPPPPRGIRRAKEMV